MRTMLHPKPSSFAAARICGRVSTGFTLVELLTVIAIIGILGAVIGGALSVSGGSGAALNNAQRMVAGMFQTARSQALMKGKETAVIFYAGGNSDSAKYLRFMGVAYNDKVNSTDPDNWKPLNRGAYLPKGVYFVPPANTFSNASLVSSGSSSTSSMQFPLTIPGAPSENWYRYVYDKDGNLKNGNAHVLLVPAAVNGAVTPPAGELQFQSVEPEQAVGIAFRKSGGVLMMEFINDTILTRLNPVAP